MILSVSLEETSTSLGRIFDLDGTNSTSLNVKANFRSFLITFSTYIIFIFNSTSERIFLLLISFVAVSISVDNI